jgi:hypothetical protein
VPDKVWLFYVGPEWRHHVLCIACWHRLVEAIDDGAFQAVRGGPVPLWCDAWRERHGVPAEVERPPRTYMGFMVHEADCRPRLR